MRACACVLACAFACVHASTSLSVVWPPFFPSISEFGQELSRSMEECPEFGAWILEQYPDGTSQNVWVYGQLDISWYSKASDAVDEMKRIYIKQKSLQIVTDQLNFFIAKKAHERFCSDQQYIKERSEYEAAKKKMVRQKFASHPAVAYAPHEPLPVHVAHEPIEPPMVRQEAELRRVMERNKRLAEAHEGVSSV